MRYLVIKNNTVINAIECIEGDIPSYPMEHNSIIPDEEGCIGMGWIIFDGEFVNTNPSPEWVEPEGQEGE